MLENWYEGIILLLEPDSSRFTEQKEDKIQGFGRFFKRILPYKSVLFLALIINLILQRFAQLCDTVSTVSKIIMSVL